MATFCMFFILTILLLLSPMVRAILTEFSGRSATYRSSQAGFHPWVRPPPSVSQGKKNMKFRRERFQEDQIHCITDDVFSFSAIRFFFFPAFICICFTRDGKQAHEARSAWAALWIISMGLAIAAAGAYLVYKYRLRSYMDSEIRAIMAQYMPLEGQVDVPNHVSPFIVSCFVGISLIFPITVMPLVHISGSRYAPAAAMANPIEMIHKAAHADLAS